MKYVLTFSFLSSILLLSCCFYGCNGEDKPGNEEEPPQKISIILQEQENYTNSFHYCRRIVSGNLTNDGTIDCNTSDLPASTGPLFGLDNYVNGGNPTLSGTYYYGVGLLAWNTNVSNNGKTVITNPADMNIKAEVSGAGIGLAMGIYSMQYYGQASSNNSITINNSGTINGLLSKNDGTAAGIYHYSLYGGATVKNYIGGICTASAPYYASGMYGMSYYGPLSIKNEGYAEGSASGGQSGATSGLAFATGIDLFTYDNASAAPINLENTGSVRAITTGGNTRQTCYGVFVWAEGGRMTLKNSGEILATNTNGLTTSEAFGIYCGGNRGDDEITNSGTITATAGGKGGWALGVENDGTDQIIINNTGTIHHNNGLGIGLFIGKGPASIVSSGSIFGGLFGISAQTYNGPITVDLSGSLKSNGSAMVLGTGNDVVTISGLPDIQGILDGNSGNNTLNFNLKGVLEKVNGAVATKGGNLSDYSLSQTGSITVSGKTYVWKHFNVKGSVADV